MSSILRLSQLGITGYVRVTAGSPAAALVMVFMLVESAQAR